MEHLLRDVKDTTISTLATEVFVFTILECFIIISLAYAEIMMGALGDLYNCIKVLARLFYELNSFCSRT